MTREFVPERDIPLILILVASVLIALAGGFTFVFYTPLRIGFKVLEVLLLALPLLSAPLVHYWGYVRERGARARLFVGLCFIICGAGTLFFYGNGVWDTAAAEPEPALVLRVKSSVGKAGQEFYRLRLRLARTGLETSYSLPRTSENKDLGVDDAVWVAVRPGRFGVRWIEGLYLEAAPEARS